MQFAFTKLFAFVIAVAAAVNGAPSEANSPTASVIKPVSGAALPTPEDFDVGTVWTDPNMGGSVGLINVGGIPSGCRNLISPFIDSISSIQVQSGVSCQFFVDSGCKGAVVIVNGDFAPDLSGTNFDNSLSSMSCSAS